MPADPFLLLGVLHLLPLPAGPVASPGLAAVTERALQDAEVLARAGFTGCVVENFGDAPFRPVEVDPHVPAMMAVVADRVRQRWGAAFKVGLNVLRNDARAALAAAAASGAVFVRVNVHAGATWSDQGLIQGRAHETLRYRRELGAAPSSFLAPDGISILADVFVKHGEPAGSGTFEDAVADTVERARADAVIVTGPRTGAPADLHRLALARAASGGVPVLVGSGVTPVTVATLRAHCDGAIVGTCVHRDGRIELPLDPARAEAVVLGLGGG